MKSLPLILLSAALSITSTKADTYESLRQEIRQSIARGNAWLKIQQKPEGNWDDPQLPAFTALALNAAVRDPNLTNPAPNVDIANPEHITKGYTWLLAQQKEDGGIYNRGLSVYNTAISLTSLVASKNKDYEPAIVRARKHLIENQWDTGKSKEPDSPNNGGIGYNPQSQHTDLSNTHLAIEALALSQNIVADGKYGTQPELDWKAALTFISRCQNLKATNDQPWASDDPQNKGGFIYTPGQSKADPPKTGETQTSQPPTTEAPAPLRSYGSMSYAGLLSLIYAKVSPDDQRVTAVKEWLGKNYTVDENPGMGGQGLFYYYQTMAKALSAANVTQLKLQNGKEADWKNDLASKILSQQKPDGSWLNENGRWIESNPVLVTAYTVLSLEQIYDSLPK